MSVTTTIAGSNYTVLDGTFSVQEALEQFTVCQFTIYDSSGATFFEYGQQVSITDSVQGLLFSGYVFSATRLPMAPNVDTLTQIICMDQHYLVAKRAWSGKEFYNQYAGSIVTRFLKDVLADEGITAGYAIRADTDQGDFAAGTLTNTTSVQNVADGDLELSLAGSSVTKKDSTTSNWNAGTLTDVEGASNSLILTSHTAAKFTSYCNGYSGGNNFIYSEFWTGNYVIQSGDVLNYYMWISSTSPAITASVDGQCSDGSNFHGLFDNNLILNNPNADLTGFANDQWMLRTVDLTSLAGSHLNNLTFAFGGSSKGTYTAYFHDVTIKNGGSTNLSAFTSSLQASGYILRVFGYSTVETNTTVVTAYDATGTRISGSTSLTGVGVLKSAFISWEEALPNTSTIDISTSLDGGVTWQEQTNFSALMGILAGADATGMTLYTKQVLSINGPDPTQSPSLGTLAITMLPSYVAIKTDVTYTKSTTTDFSAGTLTNTVAQASDAGLTLDGFWRNWQFNDISGMTAYGTATPAIDSKAGYAIVSSNGGTDARARLNFVGSTAVGQILDMSCDVQVPGDPGANSNAGLVYACTNWGNNNDSYAYSVFINKTQIYFAHGTNSTGAGAFTAITHVTFPVALTPGDWHTIRVQWDGTAPSHNIYMDGTLYITSADATYTAAGYVGLRYFNDSGGLYSGNFNNFSIVKTYTSTKWLSPNYSLNSVGTCGDSIIEWQADVPVLSSLLVESTIDGGSTYQTCTNGEQIPGLSDGVDLTGVNLKIRFTFSEAIGQETIVNGFTCWVMSHYSSSGTRKSPVLSLTNVGRVGNSLVAWNANLPTGTTLGVDTSPDGTTWTDVTSSPGNGGAFVGYTMQPDPTIDAFPVDSSANYTSTSYGAGSNATWTWDTTNRRVVGTGGTRAVLISTAPSFKDGSVIADMDYADGDAGVAVRWQDTTHLYFLKINDASSGTAPNTIKLFLKNGAGGATQVGATGTIVFPRNSYHRILLDVQGTAFTVSFDGAVVITTTDSTIVTVGLAGLLDGTKVQCYQLRIQPYGDSLAGKNIYSRLRLASTDPAVTPQVLDLTVAAYSPNIGTGALIPNTAYSIVQSASQNYLSQDIDDLAKQSNYWWRVDKNKNMFFQARTGTPAPFPVATVNNNTVIAGQHVNDFLVAGFQIVNSSPMYRNKEWAIGGTDQKTVTQTFLGDGITQTFTLTFPIATPTTPAPNPPVITVNGVLQDVGIQGTNTGMDFYYQVGSNAITQDASETPLSGPPRTQLLKVIYPAQITAISSDSDATEQVAYAAIEGGSGIVEVVESFPGLIKAATDAMATARNTQYKVRGRTFQFGTLHPGLAVGQIVPVFAAAHNLQNDQLLVSKVTTTMQNSVSGPIPWYQVEVVEGPVVGDWTKLVSNGSKK